MPKHDVLEVPHYLLIPVEGAYELHHTFETPQAMLERRNKGSYADLAFEIDGEPLGVCHMLANPELLINQRAREALVFLCDVHVAFRGDVIFAGVPAELVAAIVAAQ